MFSSRCFSHSWSIMTCLFECLPYSCFVNGLFSSTLFYIGHLDREKDRQISDHCRIKSLSLSLDILLRHSAIHANFVSPIIWYLEHLLTLYKLSVWEEFFPNLTTFLVALGNLLVFNPFFIQIFRGYCSIHYFGFIGQITVKLHCDMKN